MKPKQVFIFPRIVFIALMLLLLPGQVFSEDWVYTVVEGDNLWNISDKHLDKATRFKQIQKINGVKNPKKMRPGTRLRVPLKWIRSNSVPAEIVAVQGGGEIYRVDGRIEQVLAAPMLIQLGDRVKTGVDSTFAIRFADSTVLTLYSDSVIRFDHLSAHGVTGMVDSRLRLQKGRMDTRVKPAAGPGSRFEIHTPSAISAVRGTEYRASVIGQENASAIEVIHGKVAVKGGQKQALVKAGYGTLVKAGKAPLKPRKLLEPPKLTPIEARIRTLGWPVQWAELPGAVKYRLEVAAEQTFNTVIWQKLVARTQIPLPDLSDGEYFLRVRGVDKLGLEGKDALQTIIVDTRPQPPLQLHPLNDAVFRGMSPELKWTDSSEADKYHLQVAGDAQFEQLLVDIADFGKNSFDTDTLPETGQFYWRLTSIAADGEVGPVGQVRSYRIKAIPEQVAADLNADTEGKLVASWTPGVAGQIFQVQLADNQDFTDPEMDFTTENSEVLFDPILGQVRYLRIRAIESDGYQGPWGAVQRVDPTEDNSFWSIFIMGIIGVLAL